MPRFIRITDIKDDGTLRDETFRSLAEKIAQPYLLTEGDVLLARSGATVGKAFRYRKSWGRACFAGYLIRLRVDAAKATPEFVSWYTQSRDFQQEVQAATVQATIQNVSAERFGNFPVPVPPLVQQRNIAAFLDRKTAAIDALIEKKERLIELLQVKRQAVITQAVTKGLDLNVPMKDSGVAWLGEIPAHWRAERIASVATKITNGFVGPTRDILVGNGVRYLQSLHIKGNQIRFTADNEYFVTAAWSRAHMKSVLEADDVLVVQTGDIGQVACVPPEFEGSNCHALIIISPVTSTLRGPYLSWTLNSGYGLNSLKAIQTGALHPHLNCTFVREVVVPIPPLAEQMNIMGYVGQRDSAMALLQDQNRIAANLLREYRQGLISGAVTGKIEISDEEAA